MVRGLIFDVDGVLVDSPHERAWGESLRMLIETEWKDLKPAIRRKPEEFTPQVYQEHVSGRPRREGAAALLGYFGIPDPDGRRLEQLCDFKQAMIVDLIRRGEFVAFPDAVKFLLKAKASGLKLAAASSSKNANMMLERVRLDEFCREHGLSFEFVTAGLCMLDIFDANVCGRDFRKGKPDPEIFLAAAELLGLAPGECVVIEDAPAGVRAAKAGGMACIGLARRGDAEMLARAGADWTVEALDESLIRTVRGPDVEL